MQILANIISPQDLVSFLLLFFYLFAYFLFILFAMSLLPLVKRNKLLVPFKYKKVK